MAKKEFVFRGKTLEEVQMLTEKEFAALIPSRQRRKILRGFTEQEKTFLEKLKVSKKTVKTHCRDVVILPWMVGKMILVHKGNKFAPVTISEEMIGHCLGEFALTRERVQHSAPGIGATKSSAALSVR